MVWGGMGYVGKVQSHLFATYAWGWDLYPPTPFPTGIFGGIVIFAIISSTYRDMAPSLHQRIPFPIQWHTDCIQALDAEKVRNFKYLKSESYK